MRHATAGSLASIRVRIFLRQDDKIVEVNEQKQLFKDAYQPDVVTRPC